MPPPEVTVLRYPGAMHSLLLEDRRAFQDVLALLHEIHARGARPGAAPAA